MYTEQCMQYTLGTLFTCTWWSASKYEHLYLLLFHFLHISHLCQDAEASIPHRPRHILPLIGTASHILPLVTGLSNIASCNWPPRHILRGLFFLHGLPHSRQHHFDFPRSSQAIHQRCGSRQKSSARRRNFEPDTSPIGHFTTGTTRKIGRFRFFGFGAFVLGWL